MSPATISPTPKVTPASATKRSRGRVRRAASSAPVRDPIARIEPSTPYSPAPLP